MSYEYYTKEYPCPCKNGVWWDKICEEDTDWTNRCEIVASGINCPECAKKYAIIHGPTRRYWKGENSFDTYIIPKEKLPEYEGNSLYTVMFNQEE